MAVSAFWFGQAIMQAFGSGTLGNAPNIDYLSDTIKVALFTDAHAPDQDADVFYDAANGMTEVSESGTGYTTGGATLGTKTLGYTSGTNVIKFDGAPVAWAASNITARYAEIYDDTPASNKPLLGYVDFGANKTTVDGVFTITWAAGGILTITPTAPA
jgi:hypothetical protein